MSPSNKSIDSSIATIKFIVGLERIRRKRFGKNKIPFVCLPDWLRVYNGGTRCDMAVGPCSCKAWHYLGEKRNVRYE